MIIRIGMRMKVVKIMELMVYDGYHNGRRWSGGGWE